jgi:hypothetical protein
MTTTVTRRPARAQKPNRRPGATVVQLADRIARRREVQWTAAYWRETARSAARTSP